MGERVGPTGSPKFTISDHDPFNAPRSPAFFTMHSRPTSQIIKKTAKKIRENLTQTDLTKKDLTMVDVADTDLTNADLKKIDLDVAGFIYVAEQMNDPAVKVSYSAAKDGVRIGHIARKCKAEFGKIYENSSTQGRLARRADPSQIVRTVVS